MSYSGDAGAFNAGEYGLSVESGNTWLLIEMVNWGESGEVNLGEIWGKFGDTGETNESGGTKLCESGDTNESGESVGKLWCLEWFP